VLQGGIFKKGTTQERRCRAIKICWVFTRSTQEDQEKPLGRIQEGDDGKKGTMSKDVAAAARKDPGKAFPLAKSLGLPLWHDTPHKRQPDRCHRKLLASCHAALTAMATSQHLDHWLAC
jgi:hypothetical protein